MAVKGNTGSLAVTLPSDREILMTRVFDAPRELVFEAHTTPEHVRRWWGKHGTTLPVCEMDFRPGGAYRFVQREPGGAEHGFRGEYRDIVPPERLVYTFEYRGAARAHRGGDADLRRDGRQDDDDQPDDLRHDQRARRRAEVGHGERRGADDGSAGGVSGADRAREVRRHGLTAS